MFEQNIYLVSFYFWLFLTIPFVSFFSLSKKLILIYWFARRETMPSHSVCVFFYLSWEMTMAANFLCLNFITQITWKKINKMYWKYCNIKSVGVTKAIQLLKISTFYLIHNSIQLRLHHFSLKSEKLSSLQCTEFVSFKKLNNAGAENYMLIYSRIIVL